MRTILSLLMISVGISLSAQQTMSQDPTTPRFRSAARLIQVSVVVHDGRNRPIRDLGKSDFTLLEDGQQLPIAFFQAPQAAESRGAEGASPQGVAAAPTFTNRIESPGAGGVVAIVFDQLNSSTSQQIRAREHLLRYLMTLRGGDRVALYVLAADGLHVLYDFTRDVATLVGALQRIRAGAAGKAGLAPAELPLGLAEGLSAFEQGTIGEMNAGLSALRTETTLESLEAVAAHLSGVPGRKNIVWISAGFPLMIGGKVPPGAVARTRRAARALNSVDAALYPVDVRGLLAGRGAAVPTLSGVYGPIEGLRVAADYTGGRAFFNDNDIAAAITKAVDDSRHTYVLGYYTVNEEWDGRFREIKIRVARGGARVRHRAGYNAEAPVAGATDDRERTIHAGLASPLEATGLPVDVVAEQVTEGVLLRIRLAPASLTMTDHDGHVTGQIDVAITQVLKDRRQIAEVSGSFPVKVTLADRERMLASPIELTRTVRLHPEVVQVRLVVRDVRSGAVGSLFIDAARLRAAPAR